MSATPRPWKRGKETVAGPADGIRISSVHEDLGIAEVWGNCVEGAWPDNDNADLIVRAVNAHDTLVEALKESMYAGGAYSSCSFCYKRWTDVHEPECRGAAALRLAGAIE